MTLILSVLLLLVASGLSSCSEVALLSAPYGQVLSADEEGRAGAKTLRAVKENIARPLMTIVIWNNVANIVGSIVVGALAARHFDSTGVGVFSAVLTLLVIVVAEIIPKTIGERYAMPIALAIAPIIQVLTVVLLPLIVVIDLVVRPFRRREPLSTSEAEIEALATLGQRAGVIEPDEQEMIHRVFRLNDVTAWDIMTPLSSGEVLRGDQTVDEIRSLVRSFTHSRLPVLGSGPNEVLGLVNVRALLEAVAEGRGEVALSELAGPVDYVAKNMVCDDLLRHFQGSRRHLALVVDALGTVLGLVTIEDVLEELVGEIIDETDVEERQIKRLSRDEILADAATDVAHVNRFFKVDLPEGGRLGELVVKGLGHIPTVGMLYEVEGVELIVERATPQRIETLRIRKPPPEP